MPNSFVAEDYVMSARIAISALAGSCIRVQILNIDPESGVRIINDCGKQREFTALLLILDGLKTALVDFPKDQLTELRAALQEVDIVGHCDPRTCATVAKLMDDVRQPK